MHVAAIALGSNLPSTFGDRAANLREALSRLSRLGQIQAVSSFHDTAPVGYSDQPRFLNAAALLRTPLAPLPLLEALLAIERSMGRERTVPKGPRIVDLDLLLLGPLLVQTDRLTLPHPEMTRRRFVLEPLDEIAPKLTVPPTGLTVRELLLQLGEEEQPQTAAG
ncbi:MAG: 2-amino-4-hydroxy-6-hydroxymethyldihydropteridine diphosphokinase [Acidobacteriota bacterium]|nr:2-amino-4-hydroxy-6-hydroxymethyldihydropteridine diphosphokinase [Acidobacteriota bacterium]